MFLFVDRILELEPGRRILGVTQVTPARALAREDGAPLFPSCLVGEALGQLCAWNAMEALGFTHRPVAGLVGEVSIQGSAGPGDTILLDATIDSLSDESVAYHAVASVEGREILSLANTLGPMLPMEQFIGSEEVREQFRSIHRPGSLEQARAELGLLRLGAPALVEDLRFDHVLSREEGREIVAEKTISASAPYLRDHFPNKPVFPLSLLLECLLDLGSTFLAGAGGQDRGQRLRPVRLRNVKMNQFVPPGDTVTARLSVKERNEDGVRLSFRCEVEGQRVCIGQADFAAGEPGAAS